MSRVDRLRAEVRLEYRSFVRRRTALFFTMVFPVLVVVAFALAIRAGDGRFLGAEASYFLPGYLALMLVFAPMSRLSGSVPRDREAGRLEKRATTPLRRWEWVTARVVVVSALAAVPALAVLLVGATLTSATAAPSPWLVPLGLAVVTTFAGVGVVIGRLSDSEDGAIAVSNAIGFPLVFLSDTLLPPSVLPGWAEGVLVLSPVTHFARACRAALAGGQPGLVELVVLAAVAVGAFVVGVVALPVVRR
ncbi:MAG: ABC transporter permease [Halobacteriales archaeon]